MPSASDGTLRADRWHGHAVSETHVYLSPGLFGFARIASFDYFEHTVAAISARFAARGRKASIRVCDVHPTASIRKRAAALARMIHETARDDGPIHLVGHSTGGLDARLLVSPSSRLASLEGVKLDWLPRLASITTMNTPHFGTPLAAYFATVSGQRLLYAITAVTVAALKLGAPPLATASALVAAFGRFPLNRMEMGIVDRAVDSVIRVLDEAASRELRAWLGLLRDDQGAIVQIMPESMDLFEAAVEDREGVRYQCVASYAPENAVTDWLGAMRSPWGPVSATIFTALYNITARHSEVYPCRAMGDELEERLQALLGESPPMAASDGVVPLRSQIRGDLVWIGKADHLDVVGHFPGQPEHTDWMQSGARFSRVRFDVMMDRIVDGMLQGEHR